MSKNGFKSSLTLLFKELLAFFVFSDKKSNLDSDFGVNSFAKYFYSFFVKRNRRNMAQNGGKKLVRKKTLLYSKTSNKVDV